MCLPCWLLECKHMCAFLCLQSATTLIAHVLSCSASPLNLQYVHMRAPHTQNLNDCFVLRRSATLRLRTAAMSRLASATWTTTTSHTAHMTSSNVRV